MGYLYKGIAKKLKEKKFDMKFLKFVLVAVVFSDSVRANAGYLEVDRVEKVIEIEVVP